jgi:hypothetical protein
MERSLELATEIGLSHARWKALVNLGSFKLEMGDARGAREINLLTREEVQASGDRPSIEWDRAERIILAYFAGEWTVAEEEIEWFLGLPGASTHYMETQAREVRGRILRARGDLTGAMAESDRQMERSLAIGDPQVLFPALGFHADMLVAAGRAAEAGRVDDDLIERLRDNTSLAGAVGRSDLAWALTALQRDPAPLLEVLRPEQSTWFVAAEHILRDDFANAADVFAEIGSLPDEARARVQAARQRFAAGDGTGGARQLARARAFYESVGATAFLAECDEVRAA